MRVASWFGVVSSLLLPAICGAGPLADVEIHDRTTGATLPLYERNSRLYVVGEPKHRYELRIRNHSGGRILAVVSVDGVNVITGETAAETQSGYVIDPWGSVSIEGWRKSMDDVAAFYFTHLRDSYAARTGRPDDVGVIGVALYREAVPCCDRFSRGRPPAEAPAAAEAQGSADASVAQRRDEAKAESRLGTGHGERESSPAYYVDFRRASASPDDLLVVYYDSERNLRAQGILPAPYRYAHERPNPFPNGFVPDP